MINFEWYRSFVAIYRSGTVTSAAQARFLTQPAISQHLNALETAIGQKLFQRSPRKMLPTKQGKMLYSRMAPAMDSLEKVSGQLKDVALSDEVVVRLGTPLDYFYQVGLEKLHNAAFSLQVELGETAAMIKRLSNGRLDAVIATTQTQNDNLDYMSIGQEDFCLVSSPTIKLPVNNKSPQNIEAFLLTLPWISYAVELPIIRRFWHSAFKGRPDIEPVMVVPSLLLIRKAVEQGMGVSVLPHYLCEQALNNGQLKILWRPKTAVVNDLWLATRRVDRNKLEVEQLITLLGQT